MDRVIYSSPAPPPTDHERRTEVGMLQCNSLLLDESPIIGRDNEASEIIRRLLSIQMNESSRVDNDNVFVIPIVGMAGVGKTTLAKLVCNDRRITGHFDMKIWLDSNMNILDVAAAHDVESDGLINLDVAKLSRFLSSKRVLLVLDDLQGDLDVCQQKCDCLLQVLKKSTRGAIIITTRSHVISSTVGKQNAHYLKPLSDDDCLALLTKLALGNNRNADNSRKMVSLCGQIAKKCQGLPWTAKTLGSIMRARTNENDWTAVLHSNVWDFPEVRRNNFLSSFSLSALLKRCFAYCAILPHNQEFCKEILVQMWIAEGFVIPEANKRRIEDIGNNYFDDLLSLSIFLSVGGKYKMHTLIHELAQSVSSGKCFRMEKNDEDDQISPLNTRIRHLSVSCKNIQTETFEKFYNCKGLRTFVLLRDYGISIKEIPYRLFVELNRIRALDLSGSHVSILTDTLGNLIHLRYLNLSKTHIQWLPETMAKLYKLQSLVLQNCERLRHLPKCIESLINLRHLELEGSRLTSMPSGFGKLINLQTLGEFVVGSGEKDARISELEHMKNLQGYVRIKKLENVREEDTSKNMLDNKVFLHRLDLQWSEMQEEGIHMKVLESLQPNENLEELTIKAYSGRSFPGWVGSSLCSSLVSLRLLECRNCVTLPPLGQLQRLKSLEIAEMLMVESIDCIFYDDGPSFPLLETLKLMEMPKLTTWRRLHNNDFPCLDKLIINTCPQLTDLPSICHLGLLRELELTCCYGLSMLPQEGFPNDFRSLIIIDCPLLMKQCGEGGEYRHMIQKIPYKEIN